MKQYVRNTFVCALWLSFGATANATSLENLYGEWRCEVLQSNGATVHSYLRTIREPLAENAPGMSVMTSAFPENGPLGYSGQYRVISTTIVEDGYLLERPVELQLENLLIDGREPSEADIESIEMNALRRPIQYLVSSVSQTTIELLSGASIHVCNRVIGDVS